MNVMREILAEVQEACLFSEDDGQIGVSTEPYIDPELFDRISAALNKSVVSVEDVAKVIDSVAFSEDLMDSPKWDLDRQRATNIATDILAFINGESDDET